MMSSTILRKVFAVCPTSDVMFGPAILILLLLGCAGAGFSQSAVNSKMLEGQAAAPEFPDGLSWLNTEAPIKLRELRGKFVLLDFWTFCCINCMHVIPDLKRLEEKYSQELVVIGVHSAKFRNEKETSQIREAVIRYDVRHPVVNDADFKVWKLYGARAWPTFVLINPKGRVIGGMSGEGPYEPMDRVLAEGIPYFVSTGELVRSPLKTTLEAAARPETLLSYPGKVSADSENRRLFITDSNHNRILITTTDGRILDVIGSGEEGRRDGSFETADTEPPAGNVSLKGYSVYCGYRESPRARRQSQDPAGPYRPGDRVASTAHECSRKRHESRAQFSLGFADP